MTQADTGRKAAFAPAFRPCLERSGRIPVGFNINFPAKPAFTDLLADEILLIFLRKWVLASPQENVERVQFFFRPRDKNAGLSVHTNRESLERLSRRNRCSALELAVAATTSRLDLKSAGKRRKSDGVRMSKPPIPVGHALSPANALK